MKKFANGKYIEITLEEVNKIKKSETINNTFEQELPTPFDRLEAQVAYTALMTDTLLAKED